MHKNDKNEFELRYDKRKAYLYVQFKNEFWKCTIKSSISKVKQWCNYNKITPNKHKEKSSRNNAQQNKMISVKLYADGILGTRQWFKCCILQTKDTFESWLNQTIC